MSLIIDLTPSEEAQLTEASKKAGLDPAELVKKLVIENLLPGPNSGDEDLDAKLVNWQEHNGVVLTPDVSTQALFAKWAEEDAQLTEEECAENERIYTEIEKYGIPRVQI